jgi:PKD domain/IPT/TIG domain/Divergent InlB B-repeat domain
MRHTIISILGVVATLLMALGAAEAQAVITEPIPADIAPAPPPIPALPPAGETAPPAEAISDPITPLAGCSTWYRQSSYGGQWPATSTWWEYRCTYSDSRYNTTCTGGACNAFCPDCTWEFWDWADYFYWDGSEAVFYGESYTYSLVSEGGYWPDYTSWYWWDAPTGQSGQWYSFLPRYSLDVTKNGIGSGTVTSSPAGISCGDSCQASFDAGTVVTLTASPDASSTFSGWSGACSGTGPCQVPMDQARSVSATFTDVGGTPTITSFSPTSGWSGTRVWIHGFDFLGATSVTFNGAQAQFSVESDQFIDAYVPSGATTGPISVRTANGTGWSSSSFTLVPPPRIDSFTPTGGPFGTVVDIRGSNFTGAIWVEFNQHGASSFTVDSDSEIHATVPDGATTGPISVTTVSGTGRSSSSFAVPTPTISSFTPTSGPVGTSVDIRGTNFGWATIVTFHGTKADFTVDSDSEIHATVPAGATTGWISVAGTSGSAITSSSFTVTGEANAPPSAGFTFSCTALTCTFDGSPSTDSDGTIQSYSWGFGDGTSGGGKTTTHTYAQTDSYFVTLTVTDNGGATATASQVVTVEVSPPPPTVISLTADGYKVKGLQKVKLSWSGSSAASFDIYRNRNTTPIATVSGITYTDNINTRSSASYTYKVCEAGTQTCSNEATVVF